MKEDILQRLDLTLGALNSISVKGKENLANLSGSIAMIEEVMKICMALISLSRNPKNKGWRGECV